MFHPIVFCLCSWSLIGVFGTDVSVMEGDPVTLNINLTEIQRDDQIMLKFGPKGVLIAELKRGENQITLTYDIVNERFRDRLKLDEKTGSLTITNTRTTDSGPYKVTSLNKRTQLNMFNITVYAHLTVPVISSNSSHSSSSPSSYCSLLCSVMNVSHVTLSWYKGISVLSSISVSDLSSSISLHLEVKYQDNNTYSCVLNNPIRNQTTHLDNITQLCHTFAVVNWMLPVSVAAGALLILLILVVVGIFWICRKQRKTDQEVLSRAEDITYADPTFYKRKAQKSRVKEEDEVVYAGVAVRR